ncbi:predicted protein [Uncinocarpus reesii 1704]|uniref:Uncharacterized protein n=1 Tax=Uncinocarpus reesii (strain UAMH 1704) TaxID=336963 RepID=C4JU84_UNCRE|nr:uncharacterized protein UREG_06023 [Uncinocarpus reesii 1704]EEP81181.1 predicted protein [Uncinocarpus reesii 1704]
MHGPAPERSFFGGLGMCWTDVTGARSPLRAPKRPRSAHFALSAKILGPSYHHIPKVTSLLQARRTFLPLDYVLKLTGRPPRGRHFCRNGEKAIQKTKLRPKRILGPQWRLEIEQVQEDSKRYSSSSSENESIASSATETGPNTPAALQEVYEAALGGHSDHDGLIHQPDSAFSEQELKDIFSGAPHFLLEKGRNSLWYPHILFPWDDNTSIQNLRDRKPLHHASHSLSTLHAHLPVCHEQSGQNTLKYWTQKAENRRPTFDLGVFEVPNMLSARAKEPGCVGFRNYLELPVAHAFRYIAHTHADHHHKDIFPGTLSGRPNDPYSYCRPRIMVDRGDLLREGPTAWRRLGVRYCSVKAITERMERLCSVREDVMCRCQRSTILDTESICQLNDELFSRFLYPLPKELRDFVPAEPGSLKYQIVVLMQVLGVKGAWIDFSLVEWRIRAGQILWEAPPHQDGDCINCTDEANCGIERKWLLLQFVLTAELVLRVDAAVKLGIIAKSQNVLITPHDIYQMNELRTHQIDWGIITGRRAAENLMFQYSPFENDEDQAPPLTKSKTTWIKEKFSRSKQKVPQMEDCAWYGRLIPRFPLRQLEGLFVFAEALEWPGLDGIKENLRFKFSAALKDRQSMIAAFDSPLRTKAAACSQHRLERQDMYRKSVTARLIHLQVPPDEVEKDKLYLGGWPSRSWFSGFVIPGESTNDLLISTLLENDPQALKTLGPIANLYGGFIYQNRSYWSKVCIVGRVLCTFFPRSICMGWAGCNILPRCDDGERIQDSWVEVSVKDNHAPRGEARIYQGSKVLLESSPLGAEGDLTPRAFSLPMDKTDTECLATTIQFEQLTLSVHNREEQESKADTLQKALALVSFAVSQQSSRSETVTFPLTFNVQFISSYTCLPPLGYIAHLCSHQSDAQAEPSYHRHVHPNVPLDEEADGDLGETEMLARKLRPGGQPRLPGHPLHVVSYPYSYIPIAALAKMLVVRQVRPRISFMMYPDEFLSFVDPGRRWHRPRRRQTYIVDARGSSDKEAYARAWCSAVGTDAVVARVGRTCLACSIREARAANVPVVRVGALACEGGIKDAR